MLHGGDPSEEKWPISERVADIHGQISRSRWDGQDYIQYKLDRTAGRDPFSPDPRFSRKGSG